MKTSTTITALVLATVVVAASQATAAQRRGVEGGFPDVARVTADYPDDAERFIAFDILFNRLGDAPRGAQGRTGYELRSAYLRARGEVLDQYEQQGRGSEAYKTFTTRSGSLFSDPSFRRSVLEKYQLADLPANGPTTSGGSGGFVLFPERIGDTSDAEIKAAFYEAAPIWVVGTLAMIGLAWALMRSAGDKTIEAPPGADPVGLPQLPESLRMVSVAGRRYEVAMASGQVIDRESTARTNLVWVRTPDRREMSFTLSSGGFQTRQGHIVSTIVRPLPDGNTDILIAYNHTTDQLEMLLGVYTVHATRFLVPYFLVAVAGSIPGAFGLGLMFHRLGTSSGAGSFGGVTGSLVIQLFTLWIMGGIASAVIAAFVAVRMKRKFESSRTEKFVSDYLPEYRRFFVESTPALASYFARM